MNNNIGNGKEFVRVVFLMAQNPNTDYWEPMAYFPDVNWDYDGRNKMSYMHNGQHGPCCEAFALIDCIAPKRQHLAAVGRLKAEMEDLGYVLTILDSAEWIKSKGKRKMELDEAVYQISYTKDSELMMAANALKGKRKRAKSA